MISAIAAGYLMVFGGKVSILGNSFETEGALEKFKQFREQKKHYELENRKLDIQESIKGLQVKIPEELGVPEIYEENTKEKEENVG